MTTETITPTIPSFAHVTHPTLRAVLEGTLLPMPSILAPCVRETLMAALRDCADGEVDFNLMLNRSLMAAQAQAALEADEADATLDALRRFWSM